MKTTKRTRSEWLSVVAAWERSGQRQRAFCQDQGLSYSAFSYWRCQYLREQAAPPAFVALRTQPEGLRLRVGGIELELAADAVFVADVLRNLAAGC